MALVDDLDRALGELRVLLDAADTDGERRRQAAMYIDEVTAMKARLTSTERRVTFIGPAGVGKTAALTALAGLFIGEAPTTPKELRERSVLPVGPGVTPAFPITVRAPGEGEAADLLVLTVKPLGEASLVRLVEAVADAELFSRSARAHKSADLSGFFSHTGQREIVLNLTGYGERTEVLGSPGARKIERVRPLDQAIGAHPTREALAKHLMERVDLQRRKTIRWEFPCSDEGKRGLREVLVRLRAGQQHDAPWPDEVVLTTPTLRDLPGVEGELTLVEAPSLQEGWIGRADLFEGLLRPDGLLVLCSSLSEVLPPLVMNVLFRMVQEYPLAENRKNVALLLLDQGQALEVPAAGGSREAGQLLRTAEAEDRLLQYNLDILDERGRDLWPVRAFDALLDDVAGLHNYIVDQLKRQRERLNAHAHALLNLIAAQPPAEPRRLLDADGWPLSTQTLNKLKGYLPTDVPWSDPEELLVVAVTACPKAALLTMLRNMGRGIEFDLMTAIQHMAEEDATRHLQALERELSEKNHSAGREAELTRRALRGALLQTASDYAAAVSEDIAARLKGAKVWYDAVQEWDSANQEKDFTARVKDVFIRWAQLQPFTAHRTSTLTQHIPLLAKLQAPEEAPGFTLVAENLRRLKHLRWTLNGVNLLIGANGAGKSTTLKALRFFWRAMEEGGAELAAMMELGAFPNLRTWGVNEDEPVRVALERGQTRWEFVLRHPESEGLLIRERLTHRGEEVYAVTESGTLTYRGLDLGAVRRESGLRHLMRLKKTDLPLHQMAKLAESLRISFSTDLVGLMRDGGARPLPARPLESRGQNAFSVLQRLKDAPGQADKYEFVLDGLKLAFPGLVESLGFEATEHQMRVFVTAPGGRPPNTIGDEAEGLVQLLVDLVAVASANPGDVIALDEPDSHLHPYAAKAFLHHVDRWAWEHKLTIILATHSVVLLNEMAPTPERVFVMKEREGDLPVPAALTELHDEGWLQAFSLGDLYANDNLGSNLDGA